jgi:hypothetical protein
VLYFKYRPTFSYFLVQEPSNLKVLSFKFHVSVIQLFYSLSWNITVATLSVVKVSVRHPFKTLSGERGRENCKK